MPIKIAIVGLGNCASALIQGIHFYKNKRPSEVIGLMHYDVGDYRPSDIEIVAAFDIDKRKVGKDLSEAIFAGPNCTKVFCKDIPKGVKINMSPILDGYSDHMKNYRQDEAFILAKEKEPSKAEIIKILKESGAEMLINYLPVGSEKAARLYAECCLESGLGFINCIPVFIASNKEWSKKFEDKGLPIIGDDIKSQVGATIVHRVLTELFKNRGVKLDHTYQLNFGGNTDFLNMLNRQRLKSKKISKTNAVQSTLEKPLPNRKIHIGPSDYVPFLKDNKVAQIRMEGRLFGDVSININLRLSVEDSPNSAGVAIDAIRCMKLALDRGVRGVLLSPSSYFMKSPPKQVSDTEARKNVDSFINGSIER